MRVESDAQGGHRPNPYDAAVTIMDLWQNQMSYGSDCWARVLNAFAGKYPEDVCQPCQTYDHGQLVVPEPIEDDGEHALFA